MIKFLQLLTGGMAIGAAYGLMAMGLVMVYRATRTVNFAHGMMAVIGAFAYTILNVDHGVNAALAFGAVFVLGTGLGLLTYAVVGYPLARAAPLSRTIATILWMLVLQSFLALVLTRTQRIVPPVFSSERINVGDLAIGRQQVGVVVIAAMLAAGLFVFFRSTMGTGARAVAENREAARIAGIPIVRIDMLSWAYAGMVAVVGGALIGPFQIADLTSLNLLLVRVLAAALVGGLVSVPLSLAGGLLIGVSEQLLLGYVESLPELRELLPFIVVMGVLVIRELGLFSTRAKLGAA